jgi:hypothetical protein
MFNAAVSGAMGLAIPYRLTRNNKYPSWFSGKLKYYIIQKITFTDDLRSLRLNIFIINSLFTVNL